MFFKFNKINKPRGFNLKPIYHNELKDKIKSLEDDNIREGIKNNLNINLNKHKRHSYKGYKLVLIFSAILIMIVYIMYVL